MASSASSSSSSIVVCALVGVGIFLGHIHGCLGADYGTALTKSLLYYEAQRSGKLPRNQRVKWRGDSGLQDGNDVGVDLVGGYYDAGDNLKFGLPMAFSLTMLAWSVVEYKTQLWAKHEIHNALNAIKWGTDYLVKAHPSPDVLYCEVGDGGSDHACWQRPEDMTTPRTAYRLDDQHPGSDLAAETAAALAAASLAFKRFNPAYSSMLLSHAKQLFDFGRNHQGLYQNSVPVAGQFYSSSGFQDELLWASAWLYRATNDETYLNYLGGSGTTGGTRTMFSWDDKYAGVQILAAKLVLDGKVPSSGLWADFKSQGEQFLCSCLQKGNSNVQKTPAGLLWFQPWNNLQYVTSATFLATVYSDYLSSKGVSIQCPGGLVQPSDLISFAKSQVDYILGSNPSGMSYMVGFGSKYPTQVHHRGASIVSIKRDPTLVTCQGGFNLWFNRNAPNPNVLHGAVVGGPDSNDAYWDSRSNFKTAEPATVTPAPLVGVLARLA
ncbi:endoglucanase 13-like [Cucumis melo var. makuwa]|uniref:Endoglucanase n=1 Tax=Cucumis melo var. makuwa TaxID=1194695 RepID=A0A5D3DML2_CUCMM|nr:endoglucanase 13-like [Cucumis melo var. makuwa]